MNMKWQGDGWSRRRVLAAAGGAIAAVAVPQTGRASRAANPALPPVRVGLDAALGVSAWTAPRAIEAGIRIAIDELNAAGGVLGGRPLELIVRDNRSVVARSREHMRELAALPDLVAVFGDSFSPTQLDAVPLVHELQLPLLDPWAAADGIIDHGRRPSYTFRLALRDSWAMPLIVRHAAARRLSRLGLLAVGNGWGRSNEAALKSALVPSAGAQTLVAVEWHSLTDDAAAMQQRVRALTRAGAEALVLVGSVDDSCALVQAVAALPAVERPPVLSHWGLSAGDFAALCRAQIGDVDLKVVQTFSFAGARHPRAPAIAKAAAAMLGAASPSNLPSPAGVAHAYDLTHILARAVQRAGSTARVEVRDALEQVRGYRGLVRDFDRPFTPERHEALSPADVFMARFDAQGQLRRVD